MSKSLLEMRKLVPNWMHDVVVVDPHVPNQDTYKEHFVEYDMDNPCAGQMWRVFEHNKPGLKNVQGVARIPLWKGYRPLILHYAFYEAFKTSQLIERNQIKSTMDTSIWVRDPLSALAVDALGLDPGYMYYHRSPDYTGVIPITDFGMGIAFVSGAFKHCRKR